MSFYINSPIYSIDLFRTITIDSSILKRQIGIRIVPVELPTSIDAMIVHSPGFRHFIPLNKSVPDNSCIYRAVETTEIANGT
ncbi:MAG: hypothetical protein IT392_09365 [Nitrospirae bacterium]|nr:hypothetical protein [Nitrospirota bacterium]